MRTGKLLLASTIVMVAAFAGASMAQEQRGAAAALSFGGLRFDGALNGGIEQARLDNGKLTIAAGPKTDFFNEVDGTTIYGNAPVVLTRIDNTKPFTFVVRVAPKLASTYDAAAAYVWVDDKHWLKMALERDERGLARIVTVRTNGTSDDNNHDAVGAPSAFLKLSSDTKSMVSITPSTARPGSSFGCSGTTILPRCSWG